MATRIIKVFEEKHPALRFIGKKYTNKDRLEGSYASKWQEWFKKGYFSQLEALGETKQTDNGYLGFMRWNPQGFETTFEYWIGILFDPNTRVPEGYDFIDIPESRIGMCYIQGKESEGLYDMHDACIEALLKENILKANQLNMPKMQVFERYNCPRFTETNPSGEVILDYGVYLFE